MSVDDINFKRQILRSARFQYSPSTQPLKERSIENMIEQSLLIAGDSGATVSQIVSSSGIRCNGNVCVLRSQDVQKALDRLVKSTRVVVENKPTTLVYALAEQAKKELWQKQTESEQRINRVIQSLFKVKFDDPAQLLAPFIETLSRIFTSLTHAYISTLQGTADSRSFTQKSEIRLICSQVTEKYGILSNDHFESGVIEFFSRNDPDFSAIKWNMAQNYYVALSLGLDPSGSLLSQEVFGNCGLYLDTNVIIHGIEPQSRHYESFQALIDACKKLNIIVIASIATFDELSRVVDHYCSIIKKVAKVVPDETTGKVRGIFFQLYYDEQQRKSSEEIDLAELYKNFISARELLPRDYGVFLDEDSWWEIAVEDPQILKAAACMREEYSTKYHKKKGKYSAIHDAALLQRILNLRVDEKKKSYIVTLDSVLPYYSECYSRDGKDRLAITLDAFLQWISPFASASAEERFSSIFSEAIKYQLLPQDTFFEPNDFLVFSEMEWDTKELPPEDVENCLLYIKRTAPNLDPSEPADREKLHAVVSKYFVDPGRKFKSTISEYEAKLSDAMKTISSLKAAMDTTAAENQRMKQEKIDRKNRHSAILRVIVVVVAFLVLVAGSIIAGQSLGEGKNWLQKLLYTLPFLGVAGGVSYILYRILVGEKRKYLKKNIRELFSDNE